MYYPKKQEFSSLKPFVVNTITFSYCLEYLTHSINWHYQLRQVITECVLDGRGGARVLTKVIYYYLTSPLTHSIQYTLGYYLPELAMSIGGYDIQLTFGKQYSSVCNCMLRETFCVSIGMFLRVWILDSLCILYALSHFCMYGSRVTLFGSDICTSEFQEMVFIFVHVIFSIVCECLGVFVGLYLYVYFICNLYALLHSCVYGTK